MVGLEAGAVRVAVIRVVFVLVANDVLVVDVADDPEILEPFPTFVAATTLEEDPVGVGSSISPEFSSIMVGRGRAATAFVVARAGLHVWAILDLSADVG